MKIIQIMNKGQLMVTTENIFMYVYIYIYIQKESANKKDIHLKDTNMGNKNPIRNNITEKHSNPIPLPPPLLGSCPPKPLSTTSTYSRLIGCRCSSRTATVQRGTLYIRKVNQAIL
jgi:hypothetical protein